MILRNFTSGTAAAVATAIAQLVILGALARLGSTELFAGYVMALTIVGVVNLASDFGLRHWVVREYPKQKAHYGDDFWAAALCKVLFTAAIFVVALFYPTGQLGPGAMVLCLLVGFTESTTDPFFWLYRARERIDLESVVQLGRSIIGPLLMILAAWRTGSIEYVLVAWLAANVIRMALAAWMQRRELPTVSSLASLANRIFPVVRIAIPLGAAAVVYCVFNRHGLFYLDLNGQTDLLASFGGPFALANAANGVVPIALGGAFYWRLSKTAGAGDWDGFNDYTTSLFKSFFFIIFFGAAIGIPLADWVESTLLGDRFTGEGYLRLLVPWTYLSGFNYTLRFVMMAIEVDREEAFFGLLALAASFSFLFLQDLSWSFVHLILTSYLIGDAVYLVLRVVNLRRRGLDLTWLYVVLAGFFVLCVLAWWVF